MTRAGKNFSFTFDSLIEAVFLAAVFFTPVIFDRRLGIVFSGTKVAWLRVFVIVLLSVWVIKLIIAKQHRFVRSPLDWPVLTFLFSTTIAALTSIHVYTSFVGFYGRFEGLSTWYLFGLMFFVVTNYIRSGEQLKRIIATVVSAATLMAVYGLIQRHELDPYLWGGVVTWQRVIGTIGQPNFLAAYVLMAFFLTLVLFLEERKVPAAAPPGWADQILPLGSFIFGQVIFIVMIYNLEAHDIFLWYSGFALVTGAALLFAYNYEKLHPFLLDALLGITLLLNYICLLYTQSRGGYIGFFAGIVLFALVAGRRWVFKNWNKVMVLGLLIIAVSAVTMLRPEFSPFERFTSEITTKKEVVAPGEVEGRLELKGAAGSRGETWKSAIKIIADYPLFGIGPEVLKMVFPRYETELFRFKEAFHVKQDRCHNETFDVPVTKGLISFFVYLWLIFTVFKTGFDKMMTVSAHQRLMLAGVLAAGFSYLIQNQFSFGVVAITSLFWVLWGMVMVAVREETSAEPQKSLQNLSWADIPWLPVSAVIVIALFPTYVSFLSFQGDVFFKSGKTHLEMGKLPEAVEDLKQSLRVFPFEGTTASHLGIAYLNQGNMEEAIKALSYGTRIDAYNADNFYMLTKIFLSFYDRRVDAKNPLEEAMRNAEIVVKMDPYYAEAYETLGMISERRGDVAGAEQMYEKAFSVNPNLPVTIYKIEELSRRLGQAGKAREIFGAAASKFPENIEVFKALERLKAK
ncbi:O-antigen ligase family protein [Candidatus Saganbacteria bacterium]|uniref:O-antigen ligase family protein n=1 Tax=Candidatus Saganbacteria bacterium TaxID=2575572 RepID=A0A9D6UMN9_UNCSA|nr:O-antigen ligase family protein [Candidatus Saganbacteria bacterium]